MKIYTKTGDKGETGLFGGGRVPKNSPRIDTYGTIDELNSFIGLAAAEVETEEIKELLIKIQSRLFTVGSDLATPLTEKNEKPGIARVPEDFYVDLENAIDNIEEKLEPLKNFILPGGSKGAALLHICRSVSRRAERKAVALKNSEKINNNIIIFLNRLSDLFFVLARYENASLKVPDTIWNKDA